MEADTSSLSLGICRLTRLSAFNGDPEKLEKHVVNPEGIYVLAPRPTICSQEDKTNTKECPQTASFLFYYA
jgi:hypothetical protein